MDKNLIVSLYSTNISDVHQFNFQSIRMRDYLPGQMHSLIGHINEAEDTVSLERAVDEYLSYIKRTLDQLDDSLRLAKYREMVNQRRIYVLSLGPTLLLSEHGEPVYLASPIGKKDGELSVVTFDEDGIAEEKERAILNRSLHGDDVSISTEGNKILLNDYPLDESIKMTNAILHFQDVYQLFSTLDSITSQIDSALVASFNIMEVLLELFKPFPSILEQHIESMGKRSYFDFLGIQKLGRNPEIVALSINDDESTLVYKQLKDSIKLFMLGDYTPLEMQHALHHLSKNKELEFQIDTLNSNLDARGYVNLYSIIGVNEIHKMTTCHPITRKLSIPIYYARVKNLESSIQIATNMDESQFPKSLTTIIEYLVNPLNLIMTGPIETFQKVVTDIGLVISIGDSLVKIAYRPCEDDEYLITISFFAKDRDELAQLFKSKSLEIPEYLFAPTSKLIRKQALQYIRKERSKERKFELDLKIHQKWQQFRNILSPFAQELLEDKLVPILLRRVINELEGSFESENSYEDRLRDYSHSRLFSTDDWKPDVQNKVLGRLNREKTEELMQKRLNNLEQEIKAFNNNLYDYLMDTYSRDYAADHFEGYENETHQRFDFLFQIFVGIKKDMIEAHLTAQEWKHLDLSTIHDIHELGVAKIHSQLVTLIEAHCNFGDAESIIQRLVHHPRMKSLLVDDFRGSISLNSTRVWDSYLFERELLRRIKLDDSETFSNIEDFVIRIFPSKQKFEIDLPSWKIKED